MRKRALSIINCISITRSIARPADGGWWTPNFTRPKNASSRKHHRGRSILAIEEMSQSLLLKGKMTYSDVRSQDSQTSHQVQKQFLSRSIFNRIYQIHYEFGLLHSSRKRFLRRLIHAVKPWAPPTFLCDICNCVGLGTVARCCPRLNPSIPVQPIPRISLGTMRIEHECYTHQRRVIFMGDDNNSNMEGCVCEVNLGTTCSTIFMCT